MKRKQPSPRRPKPKKCAECAIAKRQVAGLRHKIHSLGKHAAKMESQAAMRANVLRIVEDEAVKYRTERDNWKTQYNLLESGTEYWQTVLAERDEARKQHLESMQRFTKLEVLFLEAQSASERHLSEEIAATQRNVELTNELNAANSDIERYKSQFDAFRRTANREIADLRAKEYAQTGII